MIFRSILRSLLHLFAPPSCPVCGKILSRAEHFVCIDCHLSAPLTNLWQSRDNVIEQRFWGQVPIVRAAALWWFVEGSAWQQVVHNFKYRSHWYYAENMGRWFGAEAADSGFFEDIDLIVPVPLHPLRRLERGYNQAEHIAYGISTQTSIPYCFNAVHRTRNNPPQAQMRYSERWNNIEGLFAISNPERLTGRHILIVDDVFTSGATIISLAQAINTACNGDVKISVATIAASRRLLENE